MFLSAHHFQQSARLLVAVVLTAMATLGAAHAQQDSGAATGATALQNAQTHEVVRRVVSELDDVQARKLLIERLSKEADARAAESAARDTRTLAAWVTDYRVALGRLYSEAVERIALLPDALSKATANFLKSRDDRSFYLFPLSLLASLALGAIAAYFATINRPPFNASSEEGAKADPTGVFRNVIVSCIAQLLPVAAFFAVAMVVNVAINAAAQADRETVARVISASTWSYALLVGGHIAFTPTIPNWRACPVAGGASKLLMWRLSAAAIIFNFGLGLAEWMDWNGAPYAETWLGLWILFTVHVLLIVTVWQNRHGIAALAAGCAKTLAAKPRSIAAKWPYVILLIIVGHWIIITALIAKASVPPGFMQVMGITLVLLSSLPLLSHAVRAAIDTILPVRDDHNPSLAAADDMTRRGLRRVVHVALAVTIIVGLLQLWGINLVHLASIGINAGLAAASINAALILGVAYGFWELVHITVNRQIAAERVALGLDAEPDDSEAMEGEGGGAGARLGTILPLVRLAADIGIWALAALSILGQLGVNIWPLLAGAGVVGIAIGFGAQKLVRDIISGIFFLVDDAFRKGEYIDIGSVKGTVERISLRSMQLRHHNGPLNTVPFGDIGHVTNFSRDWVVMKLSLRLTYDTDAEKVRKMIKKLGQQLLDDPEYGPKFLQPLKSQGVIEMEDSAMIMRVKFMTRPGDQWGLRRLIYAQLRDMFEKNNIRFASKEVSVRIATERDLADVPERERLAAAGASRANDVPAVS